MKRTAALVALLLVGAVALFSAAKEDKSPPELPPLPDEVKLTTGATLRGVSVIRWEKTAVVLKHRGGADPVRYANIDPKDRPTFEAWRDVKLGEQESAAAKKAAKARRAQQEYNDKLAAKGNAEAAYKRYDEIAQKGNILKGMPEGLVVKAWGEPARKNGTGAGLVQWVYRGSLRFSNHAYVYMKDGVVQSYEINPPLRR